nr:DUF1800 domain-containing protein [Chitinophagaceae bacterium]
MRRTVYFSGSIVLLLALASFGIPGPHKTFPYKKAGLTRREAAVHLLDRFTFGATPGEVDQVVSMGLEKWFEGQLNADLPDDSLNTLLDQYESLKMSNAEIAKAYPRPGRLLKMAVRQGAIILDSADTDPRDYKDQVKHFMNENGYKPRAELIRQLINQKILRAACSENQLQEVLTDFWFNHFSVSLNKGQSRDFITAYERDAIRPNALGKFKELLIATAKSPAMLTYLDNFKSVGQDSAKKGKGPQGLNENYAREIMELHTLGVDGGYTQNDVTNAARILTGWTIYPAKPFNENNIAVKLASSGEENMTRMGFVHEGDFLFAATKHDRQEKTVLGVRFPAAGNGYIEGMRLLDMLANHPSTAVFISKKLAVHFVSDNPPQSLIDKMAGTFSATKGNIKEVLLTM